MQLCERCKGELTEHDSDNRFPFPSFTLTGGALGAAGAAMTGTLLLLPLGLITGAIIDAGQCERCGDAMDDGDPAYTLMEAGEDEGGESVFTPFRQSLRDDGGEEDVWPERTAHDAFPLARREGNWELPHSPDIGDVEEQRQSQSGRVRYRYDVVTEKLVPMDGTEAEETRGIEQGWSTGAGLDPAHWQVTWPTDPTHSPSKPAPSATGTDGSLGPAGTAEPSAGSEGGEIT